MISIQEAIKAMKEYQTQDKVSDEEMVGILYTMFQQDKLNINEFGAMLDGLGYELNEDFLNMSPEDQKTKFYEESDTDEAAEGVSKEEIEDAKEYGDSDEQNKSGSGSENGQTNDGNNNNNKNDEEENPFKKDNNKPQGEENDEEREQARKLYGFNK